MVQTYRNTKLVVDLAAIRANLATIMATYPGYDNYMAVVKGDCYGLGAEAVVPALVAGGCNYLATSQVEEALAARKIDAHIPIMILVPCSESSYSVLRDSRIGVTVATVRQAEAAARWPGLAVFIRVNGGHDVLGGPQTRAGFEQMFRIVEASPATLEGIYLHTYSPSDRDLTAAEYAQFEELTAGIYLSSVPIVSTSTSLTLPRYPRKQYSNTCRIANIVYGIENDSPDLKPVAWLTSEIMEIVALARGESIGYVRAFTASRDGELVGVVPIGYGDGLTKNNAGRDVFINDRRHKILAITMDVTLIAIDDQVTVTDQVVLIRDPRHLDEIADHTHGVAEEPLCLLNRRVPREYL